MKSILFILALISSTVVFGQSSFSQVDAKQVIDTFFEGFHKGDTLQMNSVLTSDTVLQTAFTDGQGNDRISSMPVSNLLKAIAERPTDQVWDERLLDYKIQLDGNLAHVWTPYEFWANGSFSHCGANAFTLAKTEKGWKIIHLIDSRRRSSCKRS